MNYPQAIPSIVQLHPNLEGNVDIQAPSFAGVFATKAANEVLDHLAPENAERTVELLSGAQGKFSVCL
jgi:hypothetical protein